MKFNLYHASIAAIAVITSLTSFTNLVKAQEYQNLVPLILIYVFLKDLQLIMGVTK